MISQAKKLGIKTMVNCLTKSTVGISTIAHLLHELDFVDMDGEFLMSEDIVSGVTIHKGIFQYCELNGIVVTLSPL